jgi:hypothetical protein
MAYADWSFCSTYNVFFFYGLSYIGYSDTSQQGLDISYNRIERPILHRADVNLVELDLSHNGVVE